MSMADARPIKNTNTATRGRPYFLGTNVKLVVSVSAESLDDGLLFGGLVGWRLEG